jgi:hypothetical protein
MDSFMLLAVDAHAQHQRRHWLSRVQEHLVVTAIARGDEYVRLDLVDRKANKFDRATIRVDQIVGIFQNRTDDFDRDFFVQHAGAAARVFLHEGYLDGSLAFVYDDVAVRSSTGEYRLIDPGSITRLIYEYDSKDAAEHAPAEHAVPLDNAKTPRLLHVATDFSIEVADRLAAFCDAETIDERNAGLIVGVVKSSDMRVIADSVALMLRHRYRTDGRKRALEVYWTIDSIGAEMIAGDDGPRSDSAAMLSIGESIDEALATRERDRRVGPLFIITSAADVSINGGNTPTSAALAELNGELSPQGITVRVLA